MFHFRHINRKTYPQKHILICEDDLTNQSDILNHFLRSFEPQGLVQFSVVPGGLAAAGIIQYCKVDLIILDHDMPEGNGLDLLDWMKKHNYKIPVITFSGIQENNCNMITHGANYLFSKGDVIAGYADSLIEQLLGIK